MTQEVFPDTMWDFCGFWRRKFFILLLENLKNICETPHISEVK